MVLYLDVFMESASYIVGREILYLHGNKLQTLTIVQCVTIHQNNKHHLSCSQTYPNYHL